MDDAQLVSSPLRWRKSSYSSGGEGNCVEVAALAQRVVVRDSKNPEGPILVVPPAEWAAFLGSVDPSGPTSV